MKPKNIDTWNLDFTPSFNPIEMLDKGVFMDCHYNVAIKDMPASWYKHKNVYPRNKEPDSSKNYYGVTSRQSLKIWQANKWVTSNNPLGWWQWYIQYHQGRRLGKEDDWQIGRWKSFVARHMGQIKANCDLKSKTCRPAQRQGLLQWAWDSSTLYNNKQRASNLAKFTSNKNPKLESFLDQVPIWTQW